MITYALARYFVVDMINYTLRNFVVYVDMITFTGILW